MILARIPTEDSKEELLQISPDSEKIGRVLSKCNKVKVQ